ncbi:MAG: hypothetical protein ABIB72_03910 [Candidatus Falkowbacteria bacterium]
MDNQDINLKISVKANNRAQSQIIFFAVIMSSTLAFLYWLFRQGFSDNSFSTLLQVLSISYILLILPFLVKRKIKSENQWYNSLTFLSVLTLFLLILTGYLSTVININFLINSLLPLGLLLLFLFLLDYFLHFFKKSDIFLIALFILFSLFVAAAMWGTKYQSPLFLEKIVLGEAHVDTLFHSALSNSIKTYNIPSTGIDGLPYLSYHWASHVIFAFLSSLAKLNVLMFYNFGYPVIFVPFYFSSLLLFVLEARRYKKFSLEFDWVFYLVLSLAFIGYIPQAWAEISVSLSPFSVGESHLVGMIFVFLLLSLVLLFIEKKGKELDYPYVKSDYLFLFLILPLLLGVLGLVKIFWLYFLVGLYGFLFFRMGWYRKIIFWSSGIVYALISVFVVALVTEKGGFSIQFFSYIRDYFKHEWYGIFFLLYCFWLFVFVSLFFYRNKINTIDELKNFVKEKKSWELEIILFITTLSFLSGFFINLPYSNAVYFFDFPRWPDLAFVLVYLPVFFGENKDISHFSLKKLNLGLVVFCSFLLICFSYNFLHNYFKQVKLYLGRNLTTRSQIIDSEENSLVVGKMLTIPFLGKNALDIILNLYRQPYQEILEKNQRYQLIKILKEIETLPLVERRESCIYIPRSNEIYWGDWEGPDVKVKHKKAYIKIPFIVPAVSGVAMINGLPKGLPADGTMWYGYGSYNQKEADFSWDLSVSEIKQLAQKKGFKKIIIIKQTNGKLAVERIEI